MLTHRLACQSITQSKKRLTEQSFCVSAQQMEHVCFPPLSRVAICGGTHGNELTGAYMVKEMQKQKHNTVNQVGSASITHVLTNPRAVEACRRYIDTDLNRCFTSDLLR